ncbi:MAG: FGGY family carbohydrate kinase [Actinomycetota bacterium]|nr:FGGY family carbohydrate kinase [Actinomycetota bacterium]
MSCPIGLDIGSTWVKALALTPDGDQLGSVRRPTPWQSVGEGGTQMHAHDLLATVRELLDDLDAQLAGLRFGSIGISGMAEAGVLLDAAGVPVVPVPAWFDPRGGPEFAAEPDELRRQFPCVTGLPVSALATFAKLLHHRHQGLDLRGLTWLNIPEYVAHALGGDRLGEVSLVARTGLVDQDTGRPWHAALDALGVGEQLLPPTVTAGSDWGRASDVPVSMRGAVLTVAGHDHLVASVAAGVVAPHQLYDSIGTAEALVRVLEHPLPAATRGALAAAGVNVVRHLLPGRSTMLAGTRTGLVLRRVLHMVGVSDEAGRAALDAAVMALPPDEACAIEVTGAANTSSTMTVRVDADDVSPARLFAAALTHGTDTLSEVVALIDAQVGPPTETIVAGGWAGMASVRRARHAALPGVRYSARSEDTAYGAALIGSFAADPQQHDLIQFVSGSLTPVSHP